MAFPFFDRPFGVLVFGPSCAGSLGIVWICFIRLGVFRDSEIGWQAGEPIFVVPRSSPRGTAVVPLSSSASSSSKRQAPPPAVGSAPVKKKDCAFLCGSICQESPDPVQQERKFIRWENDAAPVDSDSSTLGLCRDGVVCIILP